jgi:hypothetical protein
MTSLPNTSNDALSIGSVFCVLLPNWLWHRLRQRVIWALPHCQMKSSKIKVATILPKPPPKKQ